MFFLLVLVGFCVSLQMGLYSTVYSDSSCKKQEDLEKFLSPVILWEVLDKCYLHHDEEVPIKVKSYYNKLISHSQNNVTIEYLQYESTDNCTGEYYPNPEKRNIILGKCVPWDYPTSHWQIFEFEEGPPPIRKSFGKYKTATKLTYSFGEKCSKDGVYQSQLYIIDHCVNTGDEWTHPEFTKKTCTKDHVFEINTWDWYWSMCLVDPQESEKYQSGQCVNVDWEDTVFEC